jgi:hypothetical protein
MAALDKIIAEPVYGRRQAARSMDFRPQRLPAAFGHTDAVLSSWRPDHPA